MPNGEDTDERSRRGGTRAAAATAATAVKWGLRARWCLGCGGCGGCSLLSVLFFVILIATGVLAGTGLLSDLCSAAEAGSLFLKSNWVGWLVTGLLFAVCP